MGGGVIEENDARKNATTTTEISPQKSIFQCDPISVPFIPIEDFLWRRSGNGAFACQYWSSSDRSWRCSQDQLKDASRQSLAVTCSISKGPSLDTVASSSQHTMMSPKNQQLVAVVDCFLVWQVAESRVTDEKRAGVWVKYFCELRKPIFLTLKFLRYLIGAGKKKGFFLNYTKTV